MRIGHPKTGREKPKISAFTSANIEKILELNVLVFNQRSVGEIFEMMVTLSRIVAAEAAGEALAMQVRGGLERIAESARSFPRRPRVFFEEWMDPLISGIRWVEELIEIAGGRPVFPELRHQGSATGRIVEPGRLVAANPDVIIASWCGRKMKKDVIRGRDGWQAIGAVRDGHVYEVKSTYILQPGPAAPTEGARQTPRDPGPGRRVRAPRRSLTRGAHGSGSAGAEGVKWASEDYAGNASNTSSVVIAIAGFRVR